MEEIYKDIPNYEGKYQVSNLGNIKSLDRKVSKGGFYKTIKERVLKLSENSSGYLRVNLSKNNKVKTFTVHQLVSISFLNHKPCGMELVINHIDFNKLNNNVDNLEIVTSRDNSNLKHIKSSSKYVGVYWVKQTCKWRATIHIKGKPKHLGYYKNEYDAHLAYQTKLKTLI